MGSDESGPLSRAQRGEWGALGDPRTEALGGAYREPTPAGSVRHIKNWSYGGAFSRSRSPGAPPNLARQKTISHLCSPAWAPGLATTFINLCDLFCWHRRCAKNRPLSSGSISQTRRFAPAMPRRPQRVRLEATTGRAPARSNVGIRSRSGTHRLLSLT